MIKIAHISDSHVNWEMYTDSDLELLTKNKCLKSVLKKTLEWFYRPKIQQTIFKSVLKQCSEEVDHLVHSGDVGCIGLSKEYPHTKNYIIENYIKPKQQKQEKKKTFTSLYSPVPGNHDAKQHNQKDHFVDNFKEFFGEKIRDGEDKRDDEEEKKHFPYIKIVKDKIMIIGLDSRVPLMQGVNHDISGRIFKKELENLEKKIKKIEETNKKEYFKICILHHPPVSRYFLEPIETRSGINKEERELFQEFCRKMKISLSLNGHVHMPHNKKIESTVFIDSGTCTGRKGFNKAAFNIYHINTIENKLEKFEQRIWNYSKCKHESKILKFNSKKNCYS